jgi:16S rRNA (cytosine1402-N4)-methyltransferase
MQVINDWPEEKLGQIICDYGEERNWRGIAARIIAARPIDTTAQLVKVCTARLPAQTRCDGGKRQCGAMKEHHPQRHSR